MKISANNPTRPNKKIKNKLTSTSNNFSEKYIQLTKDKPFHQTPKK